jgi:hypothetical protein
MAVAAIRKGAFEHVCLISKSMYRKGMQKGTTSRSSLETQDLILTNSLICKYLLV